MTQERRRPAATAIPVAAFAKNTGIRVNHVTASTNTLTARFARIAGVLRKHGYEIIAPVDINVGRVGDHRENVRISLLITAS